MAEVFGADAGFRQGVDPLQAGFAQQAGIGQADQTGGDGNGALGPLLEQFDQRIDADMAGGAHAIGDAKEDQPGEQGLGQGVAPGHALGQGENGIAYGVPEAFHAGEGVPEVIEHRVQVVEHDVDESHQRHGCEQEDDEAFLEVIPEAPQGVHG
ncbi:hypothetical protein D3C77_575140 [compost metagenome]